MEEDSVIYVVDDDPSLRGAIDSLLRSAGWRVRTFVSARDFLDATPPAEHACLILDIRLPGVSGLDLQSELVKKHVEVPVIFLTGHADIPMSVRAMKAGAVEFLTKPFQEEELLGAIRQAFDKDRALRQQRSEQEKELAAAARIQRGLMSVTAPQLPFATAMGKTQPCKEIGGDFFSVVIQGASLVAAIADVSGKGIAAAVMASLLQGMIHEGLLSKVPLPEIARSVNEFFCLRDLGAKYATLVIVCLHPDGRGEYINCGHIPPLIAKPAGEVQRLRESNLPVGLLRNAEYQCTGFQLDAGDRLVLVTDGVTEAENPEGDFFGDQRLEEFASLGMSVEQIFTAVCLFRDGGPLSDDCTLVGLDYLGLDYVGLNSVGLDHIGAAGAAF
jgi:serine phosphatase RsbU (regulator of sigma subunit)